MDPDPSSNDISVSKIVDILKKRGFQKEANALEEFFSIEPEHKRTLVTDCPICGNQADSSCVLCDGSGELVSIVPDDDEDERVLDELKLE